MPTLIYVQTGIGKSSLISYVLSGFSVAVIFSAYHFGLTAVDHIYFDQVHILGEADIQQPLDTQSFFLKLVQQEPSWGMPPLRNVIEQAWLQESQPFVIHDSKGFDSEPGDVSNLKAVLEFGAQQLEPELPLSKRVHVIWYDNFYCNLAALFTTIRLCKETPTVTGGCVLETEDEKILQIAHTNHSASQLHIILLIVN